MKKLLRSGMRPLSQIIKRLRERPSERQLGMEIEMVIYVIAEFLEEKPVAVVPEIWTVEQPKLQRRRNATEQFAQHQPAAGTKCVSVARKTAAREWAFKYSHMRRCTAGAPD